MTVEIVLERGASPLSAKLLVNLQSYCEAYQAACDGEQIDVFKRERQLLLDELSGLPGDLHWYLIKNILSQQCDLMNPFERALFTLLTNPDEIEDKMQLALESLNDCFIELLKNSVDAMLKHYLEHAGNAKLEMVVSLVIEGGCLLVQINDNAGGFSERQLQQFNANIRLKTYDFHTGKLGKQDQKLAYYMGGDGLGVAKLSHALMDGRSEVCAGVFEHKHIVLPGTTLIQFENAPLKNVEMDRSLKEKGFVPLVNGAKITLISPFVSSILEKSDAPKGNISFCLESLLTSTRKRKSESPSIPKRYQKSIFQPFYPGTSRCLEKLIPGGGTKHPLDLQEQGSKPHFSPVFLPIS